MARHLPKSICTKPFLCCVTGSENVMNSHKDYMEIPVKAFEMTHLQTYHKDFIHSFSKAACLADSQLILAQQLHREVR